MNLGKTGPFFLIAVAALTVSCASVTPCAARGEGLRYAGRRQPSIRHPRAAPTVTSVTVVQRLAVHLQLNGTDEPDLQPPGSCRAAVPKIAGLA